MADVSDKKIQKLNKLIKELTKKIEELETRVEELELEIFDEEDEEKNVHCPYCGEEIFIKIINYELQEVICPKCLNTFEIDFEE